MTCSARPSRPDVFTLNTSVSLQVENGEDGRSDEGSSSPSELEGGTSLPSDIKDSRGFGEREDMVNQRLSVWY